MGEIRKLLSEKLIMRLQATSHSEAISKMADCLIQEGYAIPAYKEALLKRELEFPTGLQVPAGGIAIPHADSKFVLHEAVALAILAEPVPFQCMDDHEKTVEVDIIMMLAIKHPEKQLATLQEVISMIQDASLLEKLRNAKNALEIMNLLNRKE